MSSYSTHGWTVRESQEAEETSEIENEDGRCVVDKNFDRYIERYLSGCEIVCENRGNLHTHTDNCVDINPIDGTCTFDQISTSEEDNHKHRIFSGNNDHCHAMADVRAPISSDTHDHTFSGTNTGSANPLATGSASVSSTSLYVQRSITGWDSVGSYHDSPGGDNYGSGSGPTPVEGGCALIGKQNRWHRHISVSKCFVNEASSINSIPYGQRVGSSRSDAFCSSGSCGTHDHGSHSHTQNNHSHSLSGLNSDNDSHNHSISGRTSFANNCDNTRSGRTAEGESHSHTVPKSVTSRSIYASENYNCQLICNGKVIISQ